MFPNFEWLLNFCSHKVSLLSDKPKYDPFFTNGINEVVWPTSKWFFPIAVSWFSTRNIICFGVVIFGIFYIGFFEKTSVYRIIIVEDLWNYLTYSVVVILDYFSSFSWNCASILSFKVAYFFMMCILAFFMYSFENQN